MYELPSGCLLSYHCVFFWGGSLSILEVRTPMCTPHFLDPSAFPSIRIEALVVP